MMIDENENGLKGQHNLAQGKRSGALGLENGHENRPRENDHKRENLNSDEMVNTYFLKTMFCNSLRGFHLLNSVRNYCIALINIFARTGFTLIIIPQALPVARINWPFRPDGVSQG
jgi:hypothetical protein